jgi:hypothetical protein
MKLSLAKRIMNYNPKGKRRLGKLKARWIIVVNNDMRKTGIRNWRVEAKDRDTWWKIQGLLTAGVAGALNMHKYFTICINVILLFHHPKENHIFGARTKCDSHKQIHLIKMS